MIAFLPGKEWRSAKAHHGVEYDIGDDQGLPVEDAAVLLQEKTIDSHALKSPLRAQTDAQGNFTVKDMAVIEFYVSAQKPGYKSTSKFAYHLYFKKQNYRLPKPIVLKRE